MKQPYSNMVQYAKTNFQTFDESPLNEVDTVILTWLSYLFYHEDFGISYGKKGIPVMDVFRAEYFDEMFARVWTPEETMELLTAVVASPRFRNVRLLYYRNEVNPAANLQFSAVTFSLREDLHFISFRGTDWSIVGWKEDCLMTLSRQMPSRDMAVNYLNSIAGAVRGRLLVGGHSKGGYLAFYAAIHADPETQERIDAVYSHDGPGLLPKDLECPGFAVMRDRLHKIMPRESFFGTMMISGCTPRVIVSNGVSVLQHNPVSWKVDGTHFAGADGLSPNAKAFSEHFNVWLRTTPPEQIRATVSVIFELLDIMDLKHIDEIMGSPVSSLSAFLKASKKLGKSKYQLLSKNMKAMILGGDQTPNDNEKALIQLLDKDPGFPEEEMESSVFI